MKKLLIITGPTAVGKSDFAVNLSLKLDGEIISADSMQIYKGMDIGTGKITQDEMRGINHHMLDIVVPNEDYSVGRYVIEARAIIQDIISKGKIPVIVGGTGLYINSLLFGHSFAGAPRDDAIRDKLKDFAQSEGNEKLYERLLAVDAVSASQISKNDIKRLIRALEIYEITGKPRSEFQTENKPEFDYKMFILTDDKQVLYDRINNRVDKMFDMGLLEEVTDLYQYKDFNSMQAIGYKEIIDYLDGNSTLEQAKELIKQHSRNYAKRQMTFFRGFKCEKTFIDCKADVSEIIKLYN